MITHPRKCQGYLHEEAQWLGSLVIPKSFGDFCCCVFLCGFMNELVMNNHIYGIFPIQALGKSVNGWLYVHVCTCIMYLFCSAVLRTGTQDLVYELCPLPSPECWLF